MISTLHGRLPLVIYPEVDLDVSPGGRARICNVRGEALGQRLNVQVTLDVNTGELLLFTPDRFVGAFRLGDLVVAQLQQRQVFAAAERRQELEAQHGAQPD